MIDMRGEDDAMMPHSQVRHELMHNQYNKMKEEEDHWQDVSVTGFNLLTVLVSVFCLLCVTLWMILAQTLMTLPLRPS